jgi:hypothetical protein
MLRSRVREPMLLLGRRTQRPFGQLERYRRLQGSAYARLRLSGINPASLVSTPAWAPDLSKVR